MDSDVLHRREYFQYLIAEVMGCCNNS